MHTQISPGWRLRGLFSTGRLFFPVKEVTISEAQRQTKALQWKSCTELRLLTSAHVVVLFCLPHPSQLSPVTLCNSFFHPLIGFLDCLRRLLEFFLGMCCFCFSVSFIWLFWLVRHCCFLPSYFYNVCFKRNALGLCTRSFLSSF